MMVIACQAEIEYENKLYTFESSYKNKCTMSQCVCPHMHVFTTVSV